MSRSSYILINIQMLTGVLFTTTSHKARMAKINENQGAISDQQLNIIKDGCRLSPDEVRADEMNDNRGEISAGDQQHDVIKDGCKLSPGEVRVDEMNDDQGEISASDQQLNFIKHCCKLGSDEVRVDEMNDNRGETSVSYQLFNLIKHCCVKDPKDRPTMMEIKSKCVSLGVISPTQHEENEKAMIGDGQFS